MSANAFPSVAAALLLGLASNTTAQTSDPAWKEQFKPKPASTLQGPLGATPAPAGPKSKISYTLQKAREPSAEETAAYAGITAGMEKAVRLYNQHSTGLEKHITVTYNPGVPTADGNINGSIRMGKNARNERVCMHEICHTLGVGTSPNWGKLVVDGVFKGPRATKLLQEISGDPKAVLHADRMHFWPYGLNFDHEVKSDADLIRHCKIVTAIVKDLKAAD